LSLNREKGTPMMPLSYNDAPVAQLDRAAVS
jgi:hypothetical protein